MEQLENHRPGENARQAGERPQHLFCGDAQQLTAWLLLRTLVPLLFIPVNSWWDTTAAECEDPEVEEGATLSEKELMCFCWPWAFPRRQFLSQNPLQLRNAYWFLVFRLNCKFASPREVWAGAPSPGALTQPLSFPGGFSVSHGAPCFIVRLLHPP